MILPKNVSKMFTCQEGQENELDSELHCQSEVDSTLMFWPQELSIFIQIFYLFQKKTLERDIGTMLRHVTNRGLTRPAGFVSTPNSLTLPL